MKLNRIQFTLRQATVVFILLAATIGLGLRWHLLARRQAYIVRELANRHIQLIYDYQIDSQGDFIAPLPLRPSMLGKFFGRDYFHSVVSARLHRPSHDEVAKLVRLNGIERLILSGEIEPDSYQLFSRLKKNLRQIEWTTPNLVANNSGLDANAIPNPLSWSWLAQCHQLQDLTLHNWTIDRHHFESLKELANLSNLRFMSSNLAGDDVDNWAALPQVRGFFWRQGVERLNQRGVAGLAIFDRLPHLETVVIQGPDAPLEVNYQNRADASLLLNNQETADPIRELDDGIFSLLESQTGLKELSIFRSRIQGQGLQRLPTEKLRVLEFPVSQLNDAGLQGIENFSNLERLEIGSTDVTDSSMLGIAKLPKLKILSIRNTNIGDPGLRALANSSSLQTIRLRDTRISAEALIEFSQLRPNCSLDQN